MTMQLAPARAGALVLLGLGFFTACTDLDPGGPAGPDLSPQFAAAQARGLDAALAAQQRHTDMLMRIPGIIGTAVGLNPDGEAVVRVFRTSRDVGVPAVLDGVRVDARETGLFIAFSDPVTRRRPALLGFSIGHPAITAGTIGARVVDGAGNRYILSNNHVLANVNNASIGDAALQPGPFDGGTVQNDRIGTLADFQSISFATNASNTVDAAIALVNIADVDNATPLDDGYGAPSSTIWGDGNGDGVFDNRNALLGLAVQKYGRTTKLTTGQITGVNATVSICYEVWIIFCIRSARFVDQIIIEPGTFSAGGDSGSLIATLSGANPVGLLFAGSNVQTIANRIDLALNRFGVTIDGAATPPPTPLTDVEVSSVTAPASATQGASVSVTVSIRNVGNQNVVSSFDVSLFDETAGSQIGAVQAVNGLAVGATASRTFSWNTTGAATGTHVLRGSHAFADDNSGNNARTTNVQVNAPGTGGGIHVGDLDGFPSSSGRTWSATVEVVVHDANHQPINGATVRGTWNPSGLASDECTTGELGGAGSCIFLFPSLAKKTGSVSFTVTSITMAGQTYTPSQNHDPDGSSNGTTIVVIKP